MNARARWVKYQTSGLGRDAAKLVSLRRASKGIGKIGRKGLTGMVISIKGGRFVFRGGFNWFILFEIVG